MKKPAQGMQMFHEQVNDRQKWHEAMDKRNQLIARARRKGIKLTNPHNMTILDLENLIVKAEELHEKYRHRRS